MKKITLIPLLIAMLLCLCAETFAGTITYEWNSSLENVELSKEGQWDAISIDGGLYLLPAGYPALPAVSACFVIPQESTLTDVSISAITVEDIGSAYRVNPGNVNRSTINFDDYENIYNDFEINGFENIIGFKTGTKSGYRLGSFSFIPFVYNSSTGRLSLISSADITLTYDIDREVDAYTLSYNQINLASSCLETFIENPNFLSLYAPNGREGRDGDVDIAIIGNLTQQTLLTELALLHNQMGYESEFITLQWINANIEGYDVQEKIRNHLKDMYLNNGLTFAVIVGDSGITSRMSMLCSPMKQEPMNALTDLYFSDLDGNWDSDGDHIYGEITDEIDYYSDIYVGRYPVNPAEGNALSIMVSNFDEYNFSPVPGDWQTRALLIGAEIKAEGSSWTHGSMYCDTLTTIIPTEWTIESLCSDSSGSHPTNQLEKISEGISLLSVFSDSHILGSYWEDYNYIFYVNNVQQLTNGGMLPWVCSEICSFTGSLGDIFGHRCLAEEFIAQENGGALLITAPSAQALKNFEGPSPGGLLTILFNDLLFSENIVTAGVTHGLAKDILWASYNSSYLSPAIEWTMQSVNLYGDPCTVFISAPAGCESDPEVVEHTYLTQNPVGLEMNILLTIPSPAPVKVSVFDMLGREVLVEERYMDGSGLQSINISTSSLASGVYIVNVVSDGQSTPLKCVIIR